MNVFVDTSAFMAVLIKDDPNHLPATQAFQKLLDPATTLITTNYVVVEATALLQRRSGLPAVRALHDDLLPLMKVEWVDQQLHALAVQTLFVANRRLLSLVDCVSFLAMQQWGITDCFVFDEHFEEQGFTCIP